MPRYFFNVVGGHPTVDHVGLELFSVTDVKKNAALLAQDIVWHGSYGPVVTDLKVAVTDEDGNEVFVVCLAEIYPKGN
jgi:hypothetical protein